MDDGFGEWLREQMQEKGWSELIMGVESDLSQATINFYLNGRTKPTLRSFLQILGALGKKMIIIDAEPEEDSRAV